MRLKLIVNICNKNGELILQNQTRARNQTAWADNIMKLSTKLNSIEHDVNESTVQTVLDENVNFTQGENIKLFTK